MKVFSKILSAFTPILIMIGGTLIIALAGADSTPADSNWAEGLALMQWWGWFGVILLLVGATIAFLNFDNWMS